MADSQDAAKRRQRCIVCDELFFPFRKTAAYCSGKCRKKRWRSARQFCYHCGKEPFKRDGR